MASSILVASGVTELQAKRSLKKELKYKRNVKYGEKGAESKN
jgi:hypothetical protein